MALAVGESRLWTAKRSLHAFALKASHISPQRHSLSFLLLPIKSRWLGAVGPGTVTVTTRPPYSRLHIQADLAVPADRH